MHWSKAAVLAVLLVALHSWFGLRLSLSLVFIIHIATGGWRYVKTFVYTFPRDARAIYSLISLKRDMNRYEASGDTIATLFEQTVRKNPDKLAFIMVEDEPRQLKLTFRQSDELANRIGNLFHARGFRKGDVVGLFMETRPEFLCTWLGLAKIGVVTAMINHNLSGETLAHCVRVSGARALIFGDQAMAASLQATAALLPTDVEIYCIDDDCTTTLDSKTGSQLTMIPAGPLLKAASSARPPADHNTRFSDPLYYVFTSGTTGLPKPAIFTHAKFYYTAGGVFRLFSLKADDIVYSILPLYHTSGGAMGVGMCLLGGCTFVMRRKFSASRFWDDCVRYQCTVSQYIGEICRYLLAQPRRPVDRQHRVRFMSGNGLRPQIWNEFKERFGVERIGEFYGATEGNANVLNIDGTPGAVGFISVIAPFFNPISLIHVDETTGEQIRDANGLCVQCAPGEPGQLVGRIVRGDPFREYIGYAGQRDASAKKIAVDVFRKGDAYFLSGDVLTMDEYGYLYFKDRTGDTFRWRGENVSTCEVEAVVSNVVQKKDAVVYGVQIPNVEGRAGMVAILDDPGNAVDMQRLSVELRRALPTYARPIFVRLLNELELTGTFKLKKNDFKNAGFDPRVVKDRLFYMDLASGDYHTLDQQAFDDICSGKLRF